MSPAPLHRRSRIDRMDGPRACYAPFERPHVRVPHLARKPPTRFVLQQRKMFQRLTVRFSRTTLHWRQGCVLPSLALVYPPAHRVTAVQSSLRRDDNRAAIKHGVRTYRKLSWQARIHCIRARTFCGGGTACLGRSMSPPPHYAGDPPPPPPPPFRFQAECCTDPHACRPIVESTRQRFIEK